MANLTRISPIEKMGRKSPLRIVAIGGGTGLSTMLAGLKRYARALRAGSISQQPAAEITADCHGYRRWRQLGPIAPRLRHSAAGRYPELHGSVVGRYRLALATVPAPVCHRAEVLKGHSFGNLFLTAMHQITGDFAHAVKLSSEILAIRGRIFPATAENVSWKRRSKMEHKYAAKAKSAEASNRFDPSVCCPANVSLCRKR